MVGETRSKNKEDLESAKRIIASTRRIPEKLGLEVVDSVNDLENAMSDIGMRICKITMKCETKEEYQIADNMVMAFTGKTLEHLLENIREKEGSNSEV